MRGRGRGLARYLAAAAAAFVLLAAALSPTAAEAQGTETLRVGTFNVHLLSAGFYKKLWLDGDDRRDARLDARRVGRAICRDSFRYDMIAINEAWTEDIAKPILVSELAKRCKVPFRYHVDRITHVLDYHIEDSGLMFFSRLPLRVLPLSWHPLLRFNLPDPLHSAFDSFDACWWEDCLADKGAALVRVRNAKAKRTYDVVFTHLQADDHAPTRLVQMNEARDLFGPLELKEWKSDVAFFMGDLNIEGQNVAPDSEWSDYFPQSGNSAQGFFRRRAYSNDEAKNGVSDQWYYTQPLAEAPPNTTPPNADLGRTSPGGGSRLDYIARSNPGRPLCTQHMRLAFPGLSDHLGLNADINTQEDGCNPQQAFKATAPKPGESLVLPERTLEHPGSVHWIRVDPKTDLDRQGGPWAFGFTEGKGYAPNGKCKVEKFCPRVEVYDPASMSDATGNFFNRKVIVPIRGGPPIESTQYVLPKAPFYLKVYSPDRSQAAGDYRLALYRNSCTGREDPCPLEPARPLTPGLPTDKALNAEDRAWFEVQTEVADTGRAQRLRFTVDGIAGSAPGELEADLRDADGHVLPASEGSVVEATGPAAEGTQLELRLSEHLGGERLFLTVKRNSADGVHFPTFRVGYTTNLKVLYGTTARTLRFLCSDETGGDALGDDEMTFDLIADGGAVTRHVEAPDTDAGEPVPVPDWDGISYVDSLTIRVEEDDDDPVELPIDMPDDQPVHDTAELQFAITTQPYNYLFYYNLKHLKNPQTATSGASARLAPAQTVRDDRDPPDPGPGAGPRALEAGGPSQLAYLTYGVEPGVAPGRSLGHDAQIGVMASTGTGERVLGEEGALDASPAWSPDGARIAFVSARGGGAPHVWTAAPDGTDARQLTSGAGADLDPAWTPDGERIVFSRAGSRGGRSLFVVGADGRDLERLTGRGTEDVSPAVAPDGRALVFSRAAPAPSRSSARSIRATNEDLYRLDLESRRLTRLTRSGAPERDAAFSADGRRLAFSRGMPDFDSDVYVMDADGTGEATRLTRSAGPDRQPAWSPNGELIAFTSPREGAFAIWTMRADGSEQQRVTGPEAHRLAPAWAAASLR